MIDIQKLIHCEINFPRNIANVEERSYGLLFYNEDNKTSHDSNHAVILDDHHNLNDVLEDIVSFYSTKHITPRIYSAFKDNGDEWIKPYLDDHGFTVERYHNHFFEWMQPSIIERNPYVTIKRLKKLDQKIYDLIFAEEQGEWTYKALERHIKQNSCQFFVGYIKGEPVVMASLNVMDELSRVDDVMTHPNHRRKGYASTLMDYLVKYYEKISNNHLYLYANAEDAIHIYKKVGFVEIPKQFKTWVAWKEFKNHDR